MLTTEDLYTKPSYGIDIGYRVKFILLRGLELEETKRPFKSISIKTSQNPNSNRRVIGTITNYRPNKPRDLEIEGTNDEDVPFRLRLNQCRKLKRLD